jgi:hypothetical protein
VDDRDALGIVLRVGRGVGLLGVLCLVSLGSASSAWAAACGWNPVCPYQGAQVLGDSDPASLDRPLAVAMAPNGDVVVADGMKQSVREFTATGQLVRQIGTPGEDFPGISGVAVSPTNGEIWESMGPPIVWLASGEAQGVHGERVVATDFDAWLAQRRSG